MKFPYGIADFYKIISNGYFYCDRTHMIPVIEESGDSLLFIRPRRFGKSLLLSMLENYYDAARKEDFDPLFGKLAIGKNPTRLHNQYFILKWDFSCVNPMGTALDIQKSLHEHINVCIRSFSAAYENLLPEKIQIHPENAISSLRSLLDAVRKTSCRVYLLIDEYDNFANEIMMRVQTGKDSYEALVYEEGPLKTLFKAVKSLTGSFGIDRTFITGVSPVVMSDLTSGYNIAVNIYLEPEFNILCGFTHAEIQNAVNTLAEHCGFSEADAQEAANQMRIWYNGYCFAQNAAEAVYNPTLALYFFRHFQKSCSYPANMLDANLSMDQAKLEYISRIHKGAQMILDIANHDCIILDSLLSDRFGIREMLSDESRDRRFLVSFLYYFGVLTHGGRTETGSLKLNVPNLVMRGLYVDRIQRMLLPEPDLRDSGIQSARSLYAEGDIAPLCEFVETRYFKVLNNRDYRWANELTVKTAFLSLLYNDALYIMDSESAVERGYADLTMIIRPDMRQYNIFDVLAEFKYVSLKDAGLSGSDARELSPEALKELPAMKSEMENARKQVRKYWEILTKKYGNLRLRQYAVVTLGFERVWGEEVLD